MIKTHVPVLVTEALEFLNIKTGGKYIDATLGAGGHSEEILKLGGKVLGIDWDREAIALLKQKFEMGKDLVLVQGNFKDIQSLARENGFEKVDGVLFDLGISSLQLDNSGRGFSFMRDEPLDMRLDPENQGVTAADLVNVLREDQLYELFSQTTQENVARAVARVLVHSRSLKRIEKTSELAGLVNDVYRGRRRRISPPTTIFMALRMAVNNEVENLQHGLAGSERILAQGGRLVVISFHSGEDRVVKNFLREREKFGKFRILTDKPVVPGEEEINRNPRSVSAKLRAGEKN